MYESRSTSEDFFLLSIMSDALSTKILTWLDHRERERERERERMDKSINLSTSKAL